MILSFSIGFVSGVLAVLITAYLCNRYVIKNEDEMFLQQYKDSLTDGE